MQLQSSCWPRYSHLKFLEILFARWLTHMAIDRRSQFLAGYWQEASVPFQVVFSLQLHECPQNMSAGFLQSD